MHESRARVCLVQTGKYVIWLSGSLHLSELLGCHFAEHLASNIRECNSVIVNSHSSLHKIVIVTNKCASHIISVSLVGCASHCTALHTKYTPLYCYIACNRWIRNHFLIPSPRVVLMKHYCITSQRWINNCTRVNITTDIAVNTTRRCMHRFRSAFVLLTEASITIFRNAA